MIEIRDLRCGYNGVPLCSAFSADIQEGEIVCILGPNGVGKTTFFRTMQGLLPAVSGRVLVCGEKIGPMQNRGKIAKYISYVPQNHRQPFSYTAFEMILMGRAPYVSTFREPSREDEQKCRRIMELLGIEELADHRYSQLSGGEQQMVLIARAMVQEPKFLMMDEPTSNLDFGNQARVLSRIQELSRMGIGILMITHTPDQAFFFNSRTILFGRNGNVSEGITDVVLTEQSLTRAYGVPVRLFAFQDGGETYIHCTPQL